MYYKLVLAFALILISASTSAQELPEIIDSGTCGETAEDCSWHYENGRLTIRGTGDMINYESTADRPWNQWTKDITEIDISGITSVGELAFTSISHVKDLTIPATVEELNDGALQAMTNLSTLTFEEGSHLKRIGGAVLMTTSSLSALELPESIEFISWNNFYKSGVRSLVLPESLFKNGKIGLAEYSLMSGMTIYCPKEHQTECEDYLKTAKGLKYVDGKNTYSPLENMTLQTYEKDGDGYFINGSWYQKPNDVLTGKHIKKLRYTIEEAMKATAHGDKFHVSLTYK